MIITDAISLAEYHASEFISHSKMRTFDDVGPYGYHARHLTLGGPKQETTDAMRFGNAFETFVQEPLVFAERYKEAPALEGKADDALIAEATAMGLAFTKRHDAKTVHLAMMRAQGGDVMSKADMMRIERMAESFARNADAQAVIRGARKQVTLRDDFAGCDMLPGVQSRPDWYHETGEAPDLKTCGTFSAFDREVISRGYHTQAALIDIIAGVRSEHPWIVVESEWPFRCQVVDAPHEVLGLGARWCRRVLDAMRECYANDSWPLCATRRTMAVKQWMLGGSDGW